MNNKNFGLILAGGQGTRFWPWSTEEFPKQFLDIIGDEPLITQAYNRLKTFIPESNIYIIAEIRYLTHIMGTIPGFSQSNFIMEPIPRNTAPSLILSNIYLSRVNPDANVLVVPADHYIPDTDTFAEQMTDALDFADNPCVITCGIKPTMPHTGYGYIKFDESQPMKKGKTGFFNLLEFKEKPHYDLACQYVQEGNYYWNSGMFAYKLSHFKTFLKEYSPYYFTQYNELEKVFHSKLTFSECFANIKAESIDYALMEKLPHVKMFKSEFEWNDLGAWPTVYELNPKDDRNNVSRGDRNVFVDSDNSMVFSTIDKPVGVLGLNNVAVIQTAHGLLVADMSHMQRVREVIKHLSQQKKNNC
ncbi:MAG: mannose-1-phosphate guanylyltransferase [Candidatus Omnitrophota bacterium]